MPEREALVGASPSTAHADFATRKPKKHLKPGVRAIQSPLLMGAKQTLFLAAYAKCGSIAASARAAGVGRERHYYWKGDPRYRIAFARAHQQAVAAVLGKLEPLTVDESSGAEARQ
jgi:hypothetical protein